MLFDKFNLLCATKKYEQKISKKTFFFNKIILKYDNFKNPTQADINFVLCLSLTYFVLEKPFGAEEELEYHFVEYF